jgi:hypothetical protein
MGELEYGFTTLDLAIKCGQLSASCPDYFIPDGKAPVRWASELLAMLWRI